MCFSFHEKSTISGEWLTNDVRMSQDCCFLILWECNSYKHMLIHLEFSQCVTIKFSNIIGELSLPQIQDTKMYLRQHSPWST